MKAHTAANARWALEVCREIAERDLYLNQPRPKEATEDGRWIKAKWANRMCMGECGRLIAVGQRVWWQPSKGLFCVACAKGTLGVQDDAE